VGFGLRRAIGGCAAEVSGTALVIDIEGKYSWRFSRFG